MKNTRALGLKFIAFILVLMLSFTGFATFVAGQDEETTAAAEETTTTEELEPEPEPEPEPEYPNLYFIEAENSNELILVGFVDPSIASSSFAIPSMADGKTVVAIADYAFEGQNNLTYLTIPATVKSIGAQAFADCYALSSIEFEGELDYVGYGAFNRTAWFDLQPLDFVYAGKMNKHLVGYKGTSKDVTLPHTTEKIAPYTFSGNSDIESVIISERVEYIGEGAFLNCFNLSEVTVRGSLDFCGEKAFEGTSWIASHEGDFVFFGDMLVKYIGKEINVRIPNAFTSVADKAFADADFILSLQIPATIEVIGENVFPAKAEIFCYKDSAAHKYAEANGHEIREFLRIKGDFNGDGKISAVDARGYLRASAGLIAIHKTDFHLFEAGDMDNNGSITAVDARTILRISAKLVDYDINKMSNKPGTTFDILTGYSQALRFAAMREAGFSLLEHQKIKEYNLNANSVLYLREFSAGLTAEKKAKVEKIAPDDADRLDSLYLSTLINSGVVKSAKCTIDGSKYVYEIKLIDELAQFGKESFTSSIVPVAAKEDFQKILESRWWYKLYASDGRLTYNVTYTNCSVKAVVDINTGRLESIDMHMEYKITDIAGKLGGITIKDGNGKTNGNAIRIDTVKYDDFIFTLPNQ